MQTGAYLGRSGFFAMGYLLAGSGRWEPVLTYEHVPDAAQQVRVILDEDSAADFLATAALVCTVKTKVATTTNAELTLRLFLTGELALFSFRCHEG